MITANQVAEYLLQHQDEAPGEPMSNRKLHALCYYAQAANFALQGEPLFGDEMEAGPDGPVVPSLWRQFDAHGDSALPPPAAPVECPPDVVRTLTAVLRTYGGQTADTLRAMTRAEAPWLSARNSSTSVIEPSGIEQHYARRSAFLSSEGEPRPHEKRHLRDRLLADESLRRNTAEGARDMQDGRWTEVA